MADHKVTFELEVDDGKVKSQVQKTVADIQRATSARTDVVIDAKDNATAKVNSVVQNAQQVTGSAMAINVEANDNATDDVNTIVQEAQTAVGAGATLNVNANDQATDVLRTVEQEANSLNGKNVEVNVSAKNSGVVFDTSNPIGWVLGKAGDTVKDAFGAGASFETSALKTLTLDTNGEISDKMAFYSGLLEISKKYGLDATNIAEASYNLVSAGADIGDNGSSVINTLDTLSMLAISGYTDLNTAGSYVQGLLNSYGESPEMVSYYANIAKKMQDAGVITVGEQAQNMGNAVAAGAAANVSFADVATGVAILTKNNIKPATATTDMASLYNELTTPGGKGFESMNAAMGTEGKSLTQLIADGYSFVDIMSSMSQYAEQNGLEKKNLFSTSTAGEAFNILGASIDDYQDTIDFMLDGTDAIASAYQLTADSTTQRMARTNANVEAAEIEGFLGMQGATNYVIDWINGGFQQNKIDYNNPKNTVGIGGQYGGFADEASFAEFNAMYNSASDAASGLDTVSSSAQVAGESLTGVSALVNTPFKNIASAAATARGALSSFASKLSGFKLPSIGGGGAGDNTTMSEKAIGMDFVPYDEYPALLHRGEMVLTAAEASTYRLALNGVGGSGGGVDYSALASAMSGLTVQMDGRTVGRLVEPHVSLSQGERLARM